jgi:hypothetical protein
MKRRGLRSDAELLGTVEQIFLREVLSFDGPKRVGVRIEGRWPDRSVFATAVLESCSSLAVARVYETELDRDPERALQMVFLSGADVELLQAVASSGRVSGPHG